MNTPQPEEQEEALVSVSVMEFGESMQMSEDSMVADEGQVRLAMGAGGKAAVLLLDPGEAVRLALHLLRAAAAGKRKQYRSQRNSTGGQK